MGAPLDIYAPIVSSTEKVIEKYDVNNVLVSVHNLSISVQIVLITLSVRVQFNARARYMSFF